MGLPKTLAPSDQWGEKGMSQNQFSEEEARKIILMKIAPYINAFPALASAIDVNEIADRAIRAFYELEQTLTERVKNAEKRLIQAQLDLEKAKKELELRTSNPLQFIYKTAEELILRKMDMLRLQILKQRKAFEDGASTILKRSIKNL